MGSTSRGTLQMRIVFDAATSQSRRRIDGNGFLHVTACPITKPGVFEFGRSECEFPGDPNEIVKVLRSLSVVTDPAFIASCQNLPIIDEHTYVEGVVGDDSEFDLTGDEGVDPDKKGVCGTMLNFRFDEASGWCVADLVFYSRTMIRLIQANKKVELSLGYASVFVETPGGECDGEQTTMRGNHLAMVERARVQGARVLDSAFIPQSSEDNPMKPKKVGDSSALIEKLKELLPALGELLNQETAAEPAAEPAGDDVDPEAAAAAEAQGAAKAEQSVDPDPAATDPAVDDGGSDIAALLKQLIAALAGSAGGDQVTATAGDEVADKDKTQSGDADTDTSSDADVPAGTGGGKEQIAAKQTMDSMFAAVAKRDKLYNRLSKHVGAFDHAAMTAERVAEYGVKKLGIKCKVGDSAAALNAYLDGAETTAAKLSAANKAATKRVGDSAVPHSDELTAYLAGKGE